MKTLKLEDIYVDPASVTENFDTVDTSFSDVNTLFTINFPKGKPTTYPVVRLVQQPEDPLSVAIPAVMVNTSRQEMVPVFLDSGAQINLVTLRAVEKYGWPVKQL